MSVEDNKDRVNHSVDIIPILACPLLSAIQNCDRLQWPPLERVAAGTPIKDFLSVVDAQRKSIHDGKTLTPSELECPQCPRNGNKPGKRTFAHGFLYIHPNGTQT